MISILTLFPLSTRSIRRARQEFLASPTDAGANLRTQIQMGRDRYLAHGNLASAWQVVQRGTSLDEAPRSKYPLLQQMHDSLLDVPQLKKEEAPSTPQKSPNRLQLLVGKILGQKPFAIRKNLWDRIFWGILASDFVLYSYAPNWLNGNGHDMVIGFGTTGFLASALIQRALSAFKDAPHAIIRQAQNHANLMGASITLALTYAVETAQGMHLPLPAGLTGYFDPMDYVAYTAGAILSFALNQLLYRRTQD